ncbi:round spermatid basic protein 1-like isoform X1, partial [Lates japonicus]
MADSLGSVHLTGAAATAVAPAVASAKSPLAKPTEAKGAPDNRSQSSRDFNPPPPKKVRVEERSVKPKKLSREGGVGGDGSGKEKLQQPTKQQSYGSGTGLWSFSPVKASGNNPPVPATGGSQPPTNTHKVFKQSDFFLHKAPSSSKPKKPSKDKQREKEREKGKGGGEEKKKHKLMLTSGPGSNASNNNSDISRFNYISAVKRENGEVMLPPKDEKEKAKINSEELQIKKVKKKKKKKHKEGEKQNERSCTTAPAKPFVLACFSSLRPPTSLSRTSPLEGARPTPHTYSLSQRAKEAEISQELSPWALSEDLSCVCNAMAAHYVMGIVHGEASYLPDFLDYFSTKFPSAPVKMEILGKKDIETTTMANFYSQVKRTYSHGTYRAGAMRQISLVGAVDEEVGNYFPEFLSMLEESPFLKRTLPWGTFSSLRLMSPTESDDGPIMWVRPGEQMIPVADIPKSPFKRKR